MGGSFAAVKAGFAGERPEHHMKKTRVEHPKVKSRGGQMSPAANPPLSQTTFGGVW